MSEGDYSVGGYDKKITCKIFTNLAISGYDIVLDRVIVLGVCYISGYDVSGNIYVVKGDPKSTLRETGYDNSVETLKRSPEELLALAQSWDIL